jgi:hypothetical protein
MVYWVVDQTAAAGGRWRRTVWARMLRIATGAPDWLTRLTRNGPAVRRFDRSYYCRVEQAFATVRQFARTRKYWQLRTADRPMTSLPHRSSRAPMSDRSCLPSIANEQSVQQAASTLVDCMCSVLVKELEQNASRCLTFVWLRCWAVIVKPIQLIQWYAKIIINAMKLIK